MSLYAVTTARFGVLLYSADNISAARAWASRAHGVRAKVAVRRHRTYRHCDRCDSRPCCCPPKETT